MKTERPSFRGLEVIANTVFSRDEKKCSDCLDKSCGIRDCNLQVFNFGEEKILSGGLCPKGNSHTSREKTPNYVSLYIKDLESVLNEIVTPLSQETNKKRILIPRSLTFLNENAVFYTKLYKELGFNVSISPESNEEIIRLGRQIAHSETCFPLILAHGHASYLVNKINPNLDKLLLVNAIGVGNDRLKFCPYVASSGSVIRGNLRLSTESVLMPVLYFQDLKNPLEKSIYSDLIRVFGKKSFSLNTIKKAVDEASQLQSEFVLNIRNKGEKIIESLREKKIPIYIGLGRGYTLLDNAASSNVAELFSANGLHFIPSSFLAEPNVEVNNLADNIYWAQGVKMLKYTARVIGDKDMFGVRLTNFGCGPDSLLLFHEENLIDKANQPHVVLETDGHNSNAQFGTRIIAHNEVVKKTHLTAKNNRKAPSILESPSKQTDLESRIIGLPYMGESSKFVSASFRAIGFNSEVMPTRTQDSINISKKFVSTNTCQPFAFQVGDHISWLINMKKSGIDPNEKAALFLPKARGPCRFGQYSSVLRIFLDSSGFQRVPIIDPGSEDDYASILGMKSSQIKELSSLAFKGMFIEDVLQNALLRTRPYEINAGETQAVYQTQQEKMLKSIERDSNVFTLWKEMGSVAKYFSGIPKRDERFPLVLVNGEIFVRCHHKANQDSLKLLESHNLEAFIEPVSGWIDYVNQNTFRTNLQDQRYTHAGKTLLKGLYMQTMKKILFLPFADYLKGREFHNPFEYIDLSQKNMIFPSEVQGEAAISIGESYAFTLSRLNYDGIYHVGPFGCMQENAASSRIQSLIQAARSSNSSNLQKVIPFMDAVFGESENPNLESSVALFAQNCYVRKELREKQYY